MSTHKLNARQQAVYDRLVAAGKDGLPHGDTRTLWALERRGLAFYIYDRVSVMVGTGDWRGPATVLNSFRWVSRRALVEMIGEDAVRDL